MAAVRVRAASVIELPIGTVQESLTAIGDQVDVYLEDPIHTTEAA
jgi:hypothetical protein